jgi:uncharacterized RDD family membrane protein YckC
MPDSPQPVPPPLPTEIRIAGFWQRVVAGLVDSIILGLVGVGLGAVFSDKFVQLGVWGRLVGFCITLVYFGLMNSRLFGGGTIGKHLIRTKVVRRDGTQLGVGRSMRRYILLGAPFFLNHARIPQQMLMSWVGNLVSIVLFGVGGSIFYLIIFNRRTRQSLHDLVVGSFVVKRDSPVAPITAAIWKGHIVIVVMILLASAIAPPLMSAVAKRPFFQKLLIVQQAVQKEPGVDSVAVMEAVNSFTRWGGPSSRTTSIIVSVTVHEKLDDYQPLANKIARIVLQNDPEAQQKDQIAVVVAYGWDIGIARYWQAKRFSFSPADLAKLGGT